MDKKVIYNKLTKIINGEDKEIINTLKEIQKELEIEIISTNKINNNIKQAFKRLKKENDICSKFRNVLRNGNNNFSITNGYFMITYTAEQLPQELTPYINENEKDIDDGLQFEKLKNKDDIELLSLNFELMKKVYKYNKLNKKTNVFTLQNGLTFNLQYFMDIITFLNYKDISQIRIEASQNIWHPLNIVTDNGNALLLPIRAPKETIAKRLELQKQIFEEL